jgi:hypothetical protein
MGTVSPRHNYEQQKNQHRTEASSHEKENVRAEQRIAEIKSKLEEPEFLQKLVARDPATIRAQEKMTQEITTLEREIPARKRLAEISNRAAEDLDKQIAQAGDREIAEKTIEQIVALENEAQAFFPALEALSAPMQSFSAQCALIEATMRRDFPNRARRWLGESIISQFKERFQRSVLLETQRIVTGKVPSEDFASTTSSHFSLLHRAIVIATGQHDSDGRRKYRAVGNINGLSGGLNVQHGEELYLPDDAETKKFLAVGVLIAVEEGE